VTLTVTDNGAGRNDASSSSGFGLLGLRERVELLNGELSAQNQNGGGFELQIKLPVEPNRNS
jgi:signal transduction histidine kinase